MENLQIKQDKLKNVKDEDSSTLNQYTDIIVKITELGIRSKIVIV